MCKVLEDMRNETAKTTEEQTTVKYIVEIMSNLKLPVEQAMDALSIPKTQREMYAGLVGTKTS